MMLKLVLGVVEVCWMTAYMARSVVNEALTQAAPHYPTAVGLVRGTTWAAGVPARVGGRVAATVASAAARSAFRGLTGILSTADRIAGKGPKIFLPFLVGSLTLYAWDFQRHHSNGQDSQRYSGAGLATLRPFG